MKNAFGLPLIQAAWSRATDHYTRAHKRNPEKTNFPIQIY